MLRKRGGVTWVLRERDHMGAERGITWVLRERDHMGAEREGSHGC